MPVLSNAFKRASAEITLISTLFAAGYYALPHKTDKKSAEVVLQDRGFDLHQHKGQAERGDCPIAALTHDHHDIYSVRTRKGPQYMIVCHDGRGHGVIKAFPHQPREY